MTGYEKPSQDHNTRHKRTNIKLKQTFKNNKIIKYKNNKIIK
jgi:hypothetical protein